MSEYIVKINEIDRVTHNVRRYETERPKELDFTPGQATEVAINLHGWLDEKRPFTFTSLPKHKYLEFTIKSYPEREGVTDKLLELEAGDEFILNDVFGTINYEGKGTFIAGGAGITPFMSIFRHLKNNDKIKGNRLFFANKKEKDIIYKDELEATFGNDLTNVLSEERTDKYPYGHIDKEFLEERIQNTDQKFYVCGPPEMVEDLQDILTELGVEEGDIIVEEA